jgi:phage shock protein PspC (stress-responsive transcriptional regulator)
MKKAIKINLGGLIFHIDEDAYDKLKDYLSAVSNHFGNSAEAKEIVDDVESRIAEILMAKTSPSKQVVDVKDIEEVIKIMGNPIDFDPEPNENKNYSYSSGSYDSQKRRFYRDKDNAVFGGVCSGLGAYFNLDPVIFRVLFVIVTLFGFAGVPIYLILWIAIPAALTAAQKLEMHGEDVNVSNIEKAVKKEYEQVRDNFKRMDTRNRIRNFFQEVFHAIGVVLLVLFKIFGIILGIIFTLTGICLIIGFSAIIMGSTAMTNHEFQLNHLSFFIQQFTGHGYFIILFIVIFLLFFIPVCWIIYLGLKLIFRFKSRYSYGWLGSLALWIMSIIISAVLIVSIVKNFNEANSSRTSVNINVKPHKTVYLKLNPNFPERNNPELFIAINEKAEYYLSEDKIIYGRPRLTIVNSNGKTPSVDIEKESHGLNYDNALYNAQQISYAVSQNDSMILFEPYYKINKSEKWRAQQVNIEINLPTGTVVYIDNNLAPILRFSENTENIWYKALIGKTWIMTENGLAHFEKQAK